MFFSQLVFLAVGLLKSVLMKLFSYVGENGVPVKFLR